MNVQRYKSKIATILQKDYDLSPRASKMLIDKFEVEKHLDHFEQLTPNQAAMLMIDGLLEYYKQKGAI